MKVFHLSPGPEEIVERGAPRRVRSGLKGISTHTRASLGTVDVEAIIRGDIDQERGRAVRNLVRFMHPVLLEYEEGEAWMGEDSPILSVIGGPDLEATPKGYRVRFEGSILGYTEDSTFKALTRSVIQENDWSDDGETRIPHPGEGEKVHGAGTTVADGRWTRDPTGLGDVAYSADKTLANFEDPFLVRGIAQDWPRIQPFLVPLSDLVGIDPVASGSGGDNPQADISALTDHRVLGKATYDWDGTSSDLGASAATTWGDATEHRSTLVPASLEGAATSETFAWVSWLDHATPANIEMAGTDATVTNRAVEAYVLDDVAGLDHGGRRTEFVAGHGVGQVYVNGSWILPVNPRLRGSQATGGVKVPNTSWWSLQAITPYRLVLESDGRHLLSIWQHGMIELEPDGTTFTVQPADQNVGASTGEWTPHSTRDLHISSLKDYSTSLSGTSGEATVTASSSGQRFGLIVAAAQARAKTLYRRTRTAYEIEVRGPV